MEQSGVLMPLNGHLTIKSAMVMRTTCKFINRYIKVKNYNYYPLFKRLKFTKLDLLKLIVRTDPVWLKTDSNARLWYNINLHKHGKIIKEYSSKLYSYRFCVKFLKNKFYKINIEKHAFIFDHCIDYIRHFTMCGIFSQLCIEHYSSLK